VEEIPVTNLLTDEEIRQAFEKWWNDQETGAPTMVFNTDEEMAFAAYKAAIVSLDLDERDKRVAEACARLIEPTQEHRENPYDHIGGEEGVHLLDANTEAIRSDEWKKYL